MNDWAGLENDLQDIAASGSGEVREDGEWIGELPSLKWEIRSHGKSLLIHLWSGHKSLARSIMRVLDRTSDRVTLEVRCFGRSKLGHLEFIRTDTRRSPLRITREDFRARLARFLSERFPDAAFESFSTAPDLAHSFSRLYARGRMRENDAVWAVLAAPPGDDASAIEEVLAFGLLWLDWVRNHETRRAVSGLRLLVPEGKSDLLRQRALALSSSARTEIYQFKESEGSIKKMDVADSGNLKSWLIPRSEVESTLAVARRNVARFPVFSQMQSADGGPLIAERFTPATREVSFCFRGLEFARCTPQGLLFGLGNSQKPLLESSQEALARLIRRLDLHRSALATETNHAMYSAAPERWLETLILADPSKLDARLDPRFLYSQLPAFTARDRGVLDLLGITRQGRLVIIELKASEDLQLPLQAVDYWLRVRRHQCEGDFHRCGYFAGMHIDPQPPLVWLVAPSLHFHSAMETLLKYLLPEICVSRIGVNENWRRGIKVVFRQEGMARAASGG